MKKVSKPASESGKDSLAVSSISSLLDVCPTLPGEDIDLYHAGLRSLIAEFEARTVLQVYIVEKIHECLWWCHRYERQKRNAIVHDMWIQLRSSDDFSLTQEDVHLRGAMLAGNIDEAVSDALDRKRQTLESLQLRAVARKAQQLRLLESQIALQIKVLTGLQSAYEQAFRRKLDVERLQLQNELLRRELNKIALPSPEALQDEQRQTSRRQPD